jgi:hypothetical protein
MQLLQESETCIPDAIGPECPVRGAVYLGEGAISFYNLAVKGKGEEVTQKVSHLTFSGVVTLDYLDVECEGRTWEVWSYFSAEKSVDLVALRLALAGSCVVP